LWDKSEFFMIEFDFVYKKIKSHLAPRTLYPMQ
jgi:hypothetical protein